MIAWYDGTATPLIVGRLAGYSLAGNLVDKSVSRVAPDSRNGSRDALQVTDIEI